MSRHGAFLTSRNWLTCSRTIDAFRLKLKQTTCAYIAATKSQVPEVGALQDGLFSAGFEAPKIDYVFIRNFALARNGRPVAAFDRDRRRNDQLAATDLFFRSD